MEQMVKLLVGKYDDGMLHKSSGFEWMKNLVCSCEGLHFRSEEFGSPAHGACIDAFPLYIEVVGDFGVGELSCPTHVKQAKAILEECSCFGHFEMSSDASLQERVHEVQRLA